ncbi:MAG: hypothetical protein JRF70_09585 [Deltaproteobacteria bacterium]|nr:hypothetical protein [Deltaproteobacteria bacterium]MBW2372775.1 hypothetical protein [Deltaproteobacteria bacterium]
MVVFATGFDTSSFPAPMKTAGRGSRTLDDAWADGARACLGLTVAGFPNFFLMYGPNTDLGDNSILFMIECQAGYIRQCIQAAQRGLCGRAHVGFRAARPPRSGTMPRCASRALIAGP